MQGTCSYYSDSLVFYMDVDGDDEEFTASVDATARWYSEPGSWTDPPEDDFEITKVTVNEVMHDGESVEVTEKMKDEIREVLESLDWDNWDGYGEAYDPEADYEPWKE